MIAIIKTGGKQYTVKAGDIFNVEKIEAEAGSTYSITDVLLVSDNGSITVGNPSVESARVDVEIVAHGKGEKVISFKRKRRKDFKKKIGHRQLYTRVKVLSINS